MRRIIIIFTLSTFGILAQLLMKRGVRNFVMTDIKSLPSQLTYFVFNPYIILALLIYAVGFVVYLLLLSKMQVSALYPLMVASSFTLITMASFFVFSEAISVVKLMGLLSIVLGITLLTVFA